MSVDTLRYTFADNLPQDEDTSTYLSDSVISDEYEFDHWCVAQPPMLFSSINLMNPPRKPRDLPVFRFILLCHISLHGCFSFLTCPIDDPNSYEAGVSEDTCAYIRHKLTHSDHNFRIPKKVRYANEMLNFLGSIRLPLNEYNKICISSSLLPKPRGYHETLDKYLDRIVRWITYVNQIDTSNIASLQSHSLLIWTGMFQHFSKCLRLSDITLIFEKTGRASTLKDLVDRFRMLDRSGMIFRDPAAPGGGPCPRRSTKSNPSPLSENYTEPKSFSEAMKTIESAEWQEASDLEMQLMQDRKVWKLVPRPKKRKPVKCHWMYQVNPATWHVEYTARLVANGYTQVQGKDYNETYSEAVSLENVLLFLSVAVHNDWQIKQIGIESAFLYAPLDRPVYMEQPEGYSDGTDQVYLLEKCIYGLKQSPRQWFKTFSKILARLGLKRVQDTPGMFYSKRKGIRTILVVFVDDILITSSSSDELDRIIDGIAEQVDLSECGEPKSYLSLHIERDEDSITLDGRKNINILLEDFENELAESNFNSTRPIVSGDATKAIRIEDNLNEDMDLSESEAELATPLSKELCSRYRSAVGSLNDLVSRCRPDMAFAASQLAQFSNAPNQLHWRMLLRCLFYLQCNQEAKIVLRKSDNPTLEGYTAASCGEFDVRHPHGGFLWLYGGCLVSWHSKRLRKFCDTLNAAQISTMVNTLDQGSMLKNTLVQIGELAPSSESVCFYVSDFIYDFLDRVNGKNRNLRALRNRVIDYINQENFEVVYLNEDYLNLADLFANLYNAPLTKRLISKLLEHLG